MNPYSVETFRNEVIYLHNLHDEDRLRNEVIFLHNLWHQGPPFPNPNPSTLKPINSSDLGNNKRKNKKEKERNTKKRTRVDPDSNMGSGWPVPAAEPSPVASEWPPLENRTMPVGRPVSAEERKMLDALKVQYKAREACKKFLHDHDDSDDDDDDDDDVDDDVDDGDEVVGFFRKLVGENGELRDYYVKSWESGEFRCLVCAVADNKNAGKRFLDCVGLVQHSMSISRTKNRRAHRAFGNAVCGVLGWDVNRLPTIVIKSQVQPAEIEGKTNDDDADGKDGSLSSDKLDEVSVEQLGDPVEQNDGVVHDTIKLVGELLAPTQDSAGLVSEWPPLEPYQAQAKLPLSAEEKELLEALQVQYKARQACREFLLDYEDSDGDDEDEDDMDDDELEEIEDFFSKLFGENNELRKYYENCWEHGEFRCLVCGLSDNKNAGKRFLDCVGLVQHSMSISRTKNKRAHRAFGNAVCKVLGWDINRLPTIVVKNEVKPAETEDKANDNAADGKDGLLSSDSIDEVSVGQLGEPVKQNVEAVHETITQVSEDSAPVVSRWPPLEHRPPQVAHPLSVEEKEILEVLQVQYKARQACQEFLFSSDDSDDGGDNDDEDDMEDDSNDDELEEMEHFFSKLFVENNELRKYYEKCWEQGEFRCLVCGVADNKNVGKRFHDCVGLVQHSMSIARTKNKRAHRTFGHVVCNVLGWDINRLPTIVIKSDVKTAEAKGKAYENDNDGKDGSSSSDKFDHKVTVEQLGDPVRQGVEVVHETIKLVSEGEPDESADDQAGIASNQNSMVDHNVHH